MERIFSHTKYKNATKSTLVERGYIIFQLSHSLKERITGEILVTLKSLVMMKEENRYDPLFRLLSLINIQSFTVYTRVYFRTKKRCRLGAI